jgi:hypothetical protein
MIDFSLIAESLTPHFWRLDKFTSYVRAGITSFQTAADTNSDFTDKISDLLKYTGQHTALEEMLNDKYDDTLRLIYIDENDNILFLGVDIPLNGETITDQLDLAVNADTPLVPTVDIGVNADTGVAVVGYNFTVFVPVAVTYVEAEMRKNLDNYVEATKRYDIQTY